MRGENRRASPTSPTNTLPHLDAVEQTEVLDRDLLDMSESPLLTMPLEVMEKERRRYSSSASLGLYGFSGKETHTGAEVVGRCRQERREKKKEERMNERLVVVGC
ncbi:hypothetical protein Pcinc_034878 [Petrolisthes cinctipes]|uniref:Uncharacterized protein n=1 Tax=Petrolisthes cinctipes TaxID=88211 RepID=A0AAE1BXW3_PETCI|nr:hypothetical protein Pcinc_034878 [Petrolisthes cinctipes]